MVSIFHKNIVVGVSIHPELGLEVAQIDYATRTILKYERRELAYDSIRREIADMDIFKETLQDALNSLEIPKGSEIVVTLPNVLFAVADYRASMTKEEVESAIEEELVSLPIFQNTEVSISATPLPNSTIQFTKVAYTAAQKTLLIELALQIKDLGYKLLAIDVSINAILSSLIYTQHIDLSPDNPWLLLIVDNNACNVISMQGKNYVDSIEEKFSIGEVLGDAENYSIVTSAISSIIKNLPSNCLYIISRTNLISAKILADKLVYNSPIIHQEDNSYISEPFLPLDASIDEEKAKSISLGVIGAAIYKDNLSNITAPMNLFNDSLGDVYLLEQPPVLKLGSIKLVMSLQKMTTLAVIISLIVSLAVTIFLVIINNQIAEKNNQIDDLNHKISEIQAYLDANKNVSSELFDEGTEIKMGLLHNKHIYTYYTIVGTEIPKKVWLTALSLGKYITIDGQADNLESIYSFFRNIKDYDPESDIKLQQLGLATKSKLTTATEEVLDTESILSSINADFYKFKISNAPEDKTNTSSNNNKGNGSSALPELEPIE